MLRAPNARSARDLYLRSTLAHPLRSAAKVFSCKWLRVTCRPPLAAYQPHPHVVSKPVLEDIALYLTHKCWHA